ncbi:MAG: histidine phosphatase family protein, partial [Chloroflexi bacterium]|nr:histidine phosphatase family protein [Chloroflexota bacterium]
MAHWYLVRHGETEWNAQERVQGQTDVPLSDVGRGQVARTAERLAGCGFGAVYASDLVRAQETAQIIVARGPEPR